MLLTAQIKKQIQTAYSLHIAFMHDPTTESYNSDRKVVELRIKQGDHDGPLTIHKGFVGWIGSGHRDEMETYTPDLGSPYQVPSRADSNHYRPDTGHWHDIHVSGNDHIQSIFRVIPTGSQLTFKMALDWHSSPAILERGIHADVLIVTAQPPARKNGRAPAPLQFNLAIEVGRHNTCRFGK